MAINAKLSVLLILSVGVLQGPALGKPSSFPDSLDTIFGKPESVLQGQFGKAVNEERRACMPGYNFLTYEIPAGPGIHEHGDRVRVDVTTENGVVTCMHIYYSLPGRPHVDLLSSLGQSSRHAVAVSHNFLDDKVRHLGQPSVDKMSTVMIKGASDADRWALVKANLMRLDSMDDPQIQAIFGSGMRFRPGKSYATFDRYYQITPIKRIPGSKFSRWFKFEVGYIDGIVSSATIERNEWIMAIMPKGMQFQNAAGKSQNSSNKQ